MPSIDIAITGLGAISAAGNNVCQTRENFLSGRRNGGPVSLFSSELNYPVFQVKDLPTQNPDTMRSLSLLQTAAREAINDAGLQNGFNGLRIGISLGQR